MIQVEYDMQPFHFFQAEKAKQLLYQAKYGRFGLGDPFTAMQRDSDNMKDNSFDESAIKCMYDNQLAQLENLIATQRKAQMKMREQMIASDKRYQKVWMSNCLSITLLYPMRSLNFSQKKFVDESVSNDDCEICLWKDIKHHGNSVQSTFCNISFYMHDWRC